MWFWGGFVGNGPVNVEVGGWDGGMRCNAFRRRN